ncbi:major intrinsic protein (MIP) family transporter [Rhizoctonia solani 123E]|uniref:Major intrinsic protein (MIP) family transporter n=1 Tax=Rhizoctonia solani 123E TaxID=1423351 RepID=A0A074RUM1_9AGAM|nr:major intrinsic protein (MIP) family transporter [Rhizoctonia solani 123E]
MAANNHTHFNESQYIVPGSPGSHVHSTYIYNEPEQICQDVPEISEKYNDINHRHLGLEQTSQTKHFIREPAAEFLGTMILVIFGTGVNCQVALSSNPAISASPRGLLGVTSYALNPARDLGPRLLCWATGYGRQVWTYRYQYWLYAPVLGPIVGAILGAAIYDAFIYTGPDSIFNTP